MRGGATYNDVMQMSSTERKLVSELAKENIETTNVLYEIMNSVEPVDARIDIVAEHCGINQDV